MSVGIPLRAKDTNESAVESSAIELTDSTRVEFPPSFSVPPDHVTRRHVPHRAETI